MSNTDARNYGRLAADRARERYGLDKTKARTHDARYQNGKPVEIKAAQPGGYFQVYKVQHEYLRRHSGYYVFVLYNPRGPGIAVVDMVRKAAKSISPSWYDDTGYADGRGPRTKIPTNRYF